MGVEGTYKLRVKATEARNVKFGMQVYITMHVTTNKRFFRNHLLKGGNEERHKNEVSAALL